MKHKLLMTLAFAAGLLPPAAHAEEGGGGHYMPGATATFIDALPTKPGFVLASAYTHYDGSAGAGKPLDFGGQVTLNAHGTASAFTLIGVYETPLQIFGGYYTVAATVPFLWLEVSGSVTPPVGPAVNQRDTASGIGDVALYPFMIAWTSGPNLKYDVRLGIYTPTGPYTVGKLANTGRNYWTVEPAVDVSWLSTETGREASLFAGFDFNTKNTATDYASGTSFHVEGTLAQHFPAFDGLAGVGVTGFYYKQITGDSGSGATLGSFEGRTTGVGPVISYAYKIGKTDFAAELKWLPELDVAQRLKGNYVWLKAGLVF